MTTKENRQKEEMLLLYLTTSTRSSSTPINMTVTTQFRQTLTSTKCEVRNMLYVNSEKRMNETL